MNSDNTNYGGGFAGSKIYGRDTVVSDGSIIGNSISIAGRNILSELSNLQSMTGSKDMGGGVTSYYVKLPGNYIFQYGVSPQPPWNGGYTGTFAIPFSTIPLFWGARSTAYTPTNVTDIQKTYIHGDSNIGPADKHKTLWWAFGNYA
jgi:hypothetical protein